MSPLTNTSEEVKNEIKRTIEWFGGQKLNDKEVADFVKEILNAPRIFITAAGRSELVGKAFAMRLMHLGFTVYVIGETTTPAVMPGDLFITISGSGTSKIEQTKTASKIGANLAAITSFSDSALAKLADIKVIIPGRKEIIDSYEERRIGGIPVAPLGTLFEDFTLLFLDAVIAYIAIKQNKTERDLKKKHAKPE